MAPEAPRTSDVLVLGAGIQGSCIALALAQRGHRVTLVDRAVTPMAGASGNTEGKLHLGLVYALDRTGATQRRMLTGALAFSPLLDRWLGPQRWARLRSPRFEYGVMADSVLSADELEEAYTAVGDQAHDVRAEVDDTIGGGAAYAGRPLAGWVRRERPTWSRRRQRGDPGVETVFATVEVGIDPDLLARVITRALHNEAGIELGTATEVKGATRTHGGFAVDVVARGGSPEQRHATTVVNCLWDDRLRVDETVGVGSPVKTWTYRTKHLVVVQPRLGVGRVPTITMVQGAYGDIVEWNPAKVCMTWYPVCRTELRTNNDAGGREQDPVSAPEQVAKETLHVMSGLFPALAGATVLDVRTGVIVAPGATDIDDPESRLHERSSPAVHEHDGWWTVDTGKLTLAPLLAHEAATRIDAGLRGA